MERRKRRWWTRGITWLSLVAITGALLSALFQLAVALVPDYRDEVAQKASAALDQAVEVDALALRWRWLWPLLELKGVRLLSAEDRLPIVDVERIRLGFDLTALLRGQWVPAEVEVDGVALATEVTPQGQWRLVGRASQRPPPTFDEVARALRRFERLKAERVSITVDDQRAAAQRFEALLQKGDLRLDDQGFELRAEWQAPQLIASRLRLRAGMTGDLQQPAGWQGRWTLDASGLDPGAPLQRWLPALARVQWTDATLAASGDWQQGAPGNSQLSLRAQSLVLAGEPGSTLKEVDLGLHYRPSPQGGTVDVVPLRLTGRKGQWPTTTARLEWQRARPEAARQWNVSSDFLRLDDLSPWLAAFSPASPHTAAVGSLRGDLAALEARWQPQAQGTPRYRLHTRFTDLALRLPERAGVQGLTGEITADENGGRATVQGKAVTVELPRVFAQAPRASRLQADAQWQREGADWRLRLPRLSWALLGSEGQGSAELRLPEGQSPQLKLQAQFAVDDVAALKPLMPLHWGQSLKAWLDRAVVRGRIAKAQLEIDGPLADFPFHARPTGRWSLLLPVQGARLEYHRDWPGVDQLAATLRFAGNGLSFEAQRGVISGVAVRRAKGSISDFATAPLLVDGVAEGEAPYYYDFLRGSPLAPRLAALLQHSQAAGMAETRVQLQIPLHANSGFKTLARGEVVLAGNQLKHDALDRSITDITGTLRFGDGPGVSAQDLRGQLYDTALTARIAADGEGHDVLEAQGLIDLQAPEGLAARYVPRWLRPALRGASEWRVSIPFAGPRSGRVLLSSPLVGVTATLPPPLGKPAEAPLPITLDLHADERTPLRIEADIPGRLGLALRFARGSREQSTVLRGLALRLGAGEAPVLAASDGWQLTGALERLDPVAWRPLLAALMDGEGAGSGESLPFLGAALQVQQLHLAGFDTPPLRITAKRESGTLGATLQGEGTQGSLRLSPGGNTLNARFSRLQLQATPKSAVANAVTPVSEPTDPTRAPTLEVGVEALTIGGQSFGALTLQSERTASGQRLRQFSLKGGIATLAAEGEWRRSQGMTEAQSRFTVTSDDLAGTLQALGYAPTLAGRNARIQGDLTWPAAARGFDWPQGRGEVSLAVEDGALRMVEPGNTSRVLGLFNFYALPRRLTLDFGDVVSQGLGFDRIEGQFRLADGVARTDDLTVQGPSLRVAVRGELGLAAQNYNQVITVTPNTKGITLGALLLGGAASVAAPVLPVLAVIANQVIDAPLGQVTQLTYRLTGSWDNPEIQKLDDAPAIPREETAP